MARIAIDIDDTLYPFGDLARKVFCDLAIERGDKRAQRGAYCAWTEWRTPSDVASPDFWTEVIAICHEPSTIIQQRPFDHAVTVLRELYADHDLLYISNRAEATIQATSQWLLLCGFPHGDLVCTTQSKLPYMSDCQYLIDDRPKTLVEFVYSPAWQFRSDPTTTVRQGFGLHMPYNAALTDVPGIKLAPNWLLLREYLREAELLAKAAV